MKVEVRKEGVNKMIHTDIAIGTRVQSLWDTEAKGIIKVPVRLDRNAAEVIVLWDTGKTTKEVFGCDVKIIVAKEDKKPKKQILVCSASDYRRRPCPYKGAPTTKCKASLPYKDGTCLHYHPDRLGVTPCGVK